MFKLFKRRPYKRPYHGVEDMGLSGRTRVDRLHALKNRGTNSTSTK
jgi:hypothetical protein